MLETTMGEVLNPEDSQTTQPDELVAQLRLANMALKLISGDQSVPAGLRDSIQEQLDILWPYGMSDCAFTGYCQTVTNIDKKTKTDEDFVDIADGTSEGFCIAKFGRPGHERWAVAFHFLMHEYDEQGDTHRTDYLLHTGAPYGVLPYEEVDSVFPEGLDFPNLHKTLSEHSDKLAAEMQDDDFYELNAANQEERIDIALKQAELEARELGGIEKPVIIEGEYGYVIRSSRTGNYFAPCNLEPIFVKGRCVDMTVLERQRTINDVQIAGPEDVVHLGAGICLMVKPDAETAESLDISIDDCVYVPISGQDILVTFFSNTAQLA